MPPTASPEFAARTVRTLQIVVGALIMGVISFGVVTQFIPRNKPADNELMFYIGLGMTVFILIGRVLVSSQFVTANRKHLIDGDWSSGKNNSGNQLPDDATDADRLYLVFNMYTILRAALHEGAAFLNLVMYLPSGNIGSFAVAAAMLLLMLVEFPTRSRADDWVNEQLALIDAEKSFSRDG